MQDEQLIKVVGTRGCELLRHTTAVDRYLAEGGKRDVTNEQKLKEQVEYDKRRNMSDPYQILLYDTKEYNKRGNFKGSQGETILSRIRALSEGSKELDLSTFLVFDDFVIQHLCQYLRSSKCVITTLNLAQTKVSVEGATEVARSAHSLETLQFSERPISFVDIRRDIYRLKRVFLPNMKYQHHDAAAIGILMSKEKQVELIDMSNNPLSGHLCNVFHGISIFFDGLKRCSNLMELDLSSTGLRAEGLIYFANAIKHFKSLQTLRLSRNELALNGFDDKLLAGIDTFCNCLWEATRLTRLDLSENGLDYACSLPITRMLKLNVVLKHLDLSHNPLFDVGGIEIANALDRNTVLEELVLADCHISCDALVAFANFVDTRNRTLRSLDLRENTNIRSKGLKAFIKSLEANIAITQLHFTIPPESKHAKYEQHLQELTFVNRMFQALRKDLQLPDFASLSEISRTIFIKKLSQMSEQELLALAQAQKLQQLTISDQQQSNLQYFAQRQEFAPLKHLLWNLEASDRHQELVQRKQREKVELKAEEQEGWSLPLISSNATKLT